MPYWSDYVVDRYGTVIPAATVSVTNVNGTTPVLYSNALRTTVKTQPFLTDNEGHFEFYIAPGRYVILAQSAGFSQTDMFDIGTPGVETVVDFGAVGDGVTDDSAAIQATINAVINSPGGEVLLPTADASYKINTELTAAFTADKDASLTIRAESSRARITAGTAGMVMLSITNTVQNVRRVHVDGVMFNMNNLAAEAIRMTNAAYNRITRCEAVNGAANSKFIRLTGLCVRNQIEGNFLLQSGTDGIGISIEGTSTANSVLGNNFGEDLGIGVNLDTGTSENVISGGNVFYACNTAVTAQGSDGNLIEGNIIKTMDEHPIKLTSCSWNTIRGNQFKDIGDAVGSWYDVFITTAGGVPSDYNVVDDNTMRDGDASHVRIAEPAGTATGNSITGNRMDATSSTIVTDGGTSTIVARNTGWLTEGSGTGTIASGATTAVITHGLSITPSIQNISIVFGEQGTADYGRWWVSTITSTQFTLNVSADPGASNLDFGWRIG